MSEPGNPGQVAVGSFIAQVQGDRSRAIIRVTGLTPEQVRDYMDAIHREDSVALRKIEELSRELGVKSEAVANFFRILGEHDLPLERLPQALVEIAQRHKQMLERLAVLDVEDPSTRQKVEEAQEAVRVGHYDHADEILSEAESEERTALEAAEKMAVQVQAAVEKRRLAIASTLAERGELAMTRLDYLHATEHFRAASAEFPRERAPLEWARIQDHLGVALSYLGDWENDSATLEEAVAAYRAALEVYTREREPLEWAMTWNHLGDALASLGEREDGTARLLDAVGAYRATLAAYTAQQAPLEWLAVHNDLGLTLSAIAQREGSTRRLEEAVAAYRAALEARDRVPDPVVWSIPLANLGHALRILGALESDAKRLGEAVATYRAALQGIRNELPDRWAFIQNALGVALLVLGEQESDPARLKEAVEAHRAALGVYTRNQWPLEWAASHVSLADALLMLGSLESSTATLEEAVAAYRNALEESPRLQDSFDLAATRSRLRAALDALAEQSTQPR